MYRGTKALNFKGLCIGELRNNSVPDKNLRVVREGHVASDKVRNSFLNPSDNLLLPTSCICVRGASNVLKVSFLKFGKIMIFLGKKDEKERKSVILNFSFFPLNRQKSLTEKYTPLL